MRREMARPRKSPIDPPATPRLREARIAVWVDELQTFARTGELSAFRTLGLEEHLDVGGGAGERGIAC